MGRDLYVNNERINDSYGADKHCKYILEGDLSKNEIIEFIQETSDDISNGNISDVDNALMGICVMSRIAFEHLKTNPYNEVEISLLDINTLNRIIKDADIDENEPMLRFIRNIKCNTDGDDLLDSLYETFHEEKGKCKIDTYKHLEIEDYLQKAIAKYVEIKKILETHMIKKRSLFDANNVVNVLFG